MEDGLSFFLDDDVAAYLESLPALCEHDLLERADPSNDDDLQLLLAATADAVPDVALDARTDALSGHQSGEQRATEPPPPPQRRPRAKRSRNLARERMQSELKQLRVECADLETQFAELKRQRTLSEGEQLLLASWHRVQDQRTKRLRAERENEQLKQAIAHQTALAASLTQSAQLLAQACNSASAACSINELMQLSSRFPRRLCTDQHDAAVFATLVAEVTAAYAQAESVFEDAGLRTWQRQVTSTDSSQSRAQMKMRRSETLDDGAFYIELLDARVHPCAMNVLFRAMWEFWEQQYAPTSCVLFDLEASTSDSDGALIARVSFDLVVDGAHVALEFLAVMKQFALASGAITTVWRSVSVPNARFPDVYVDETGWEELASTRDGGSTVLTCTQIETKTRSECKTLMDPSLAAPLANVLVSSYAAEMEKVNDSMAGLLLDETASSTE